MTFQPPREEPYGKVSRRIWGDEKFLGLSAPKPNARDLWLYFLTGPEPTIIPGLIPRMGIGVLSDSLKWPYGATLRVWKEIHAAGMAEADFKAGVIWLPKAIIHNSPANPNVVLAWRKVTLPECPLVIRALLTIRARLSLKPKPKEGWPTFLEAFDKAFMERFPAITGPIVPILRHDDDASPVNGSPDGIDNRSGDIFANGSANQDQDLEQDQENTPLPPSEGGVEPSTRKPSKAERDWAEGLIRANGGLCLHVKDGEPECESRWVCIGKLVMRQRQHEAHGMNRAITEASS
jgi:hypothetical protein